MRPARARVVGHFDSAGPPQDATVTIDRDRGLFEVRPFRRRKSYTLPLAKVAEMVAQRCIKAEVMTKRFEKAKARKIRRGR